MDNEKANEYLKNIYSKLTANKDERKSFVLLPKDGSIAIVEISESTAEYAITLESLKRTSNTEDSILELKYPLLKVPDSQKPLPSDLIAPKYQFKIKDAQPIVINPNNIA